MSTAILTSVQVIEQLDRILASDTFINSNVLSQFLKFIVEETLAGQGKQLKEYTIGLKVLSKKPDFQPQTDPIVRIHAGRLRRTLVEYYSGKGKHDPVVISIPKGGYVPVFSGPDSFLAVPSIAAPNTPPDPVIRKKTTVAILPFRNNSTDSSTIFFADGLADQISTELASYPELSVVSYYSCRAIAEKISDVREAGLLLDAKYILTGTVQSDNRQLRVRVQLILSETREQLWAGSFERKTTKKDYFDVQDEIVRKVISQTAGHYGAIYRDAARITSIHSIDDLKLYDAIFWYYHFVNDLSETIYPKALAALRYAVQADPDYAMGWAVLGEIYVGGYFMGYSQPDVDNVLEEGLRCGRKALALDLNCQHAYQTIALCSLFLHRKADTLKIVQEWMKVKPAAAGIMGGMGFCLICCEEYETGIKLMDDSVQLNPYYQWWFNGGFSFYYFKKEAYLDAIYWAEKMNLPHMPWDLLMKTASLAAMNQMEDARKTFLQFQQRFAHLLPFLEPYLNAFIQDKSLTQRIYAEIMKAKALI